jgi:hypothetical protein
MITENDMRNILRQRCAEVGGQRAWSRINGISGQYVCDVLSGRKHVSDRLAKSLGYDRTIRFFACIGDIKS